MNDYRARLHRRGVIGGAIGLAAGAVLDAGPVAAGRGWCRVDPVVAIDGEVADIFVAVPLADILAVNGATEIVVALPAGVDGRLVVPGLWATEKGDFSGAGFRHGEYTRFVKSRRLERTRDGIEVKVSVRVPARGKVPVRVEFAPRIVGVLRPDATKGAANAWVRLKTTFQPGGRSARVVFPSVSFF